MPPAARVGDIVDHGGSVGPPGVFSVLIGGKPAAVVGTVVICPIHAELGPANVVIPSPGSMTVLIGELPAACQGSQATCAASISLGALNVLIGGG